MSAAIAMAELIAEQHEPRGAGAHLVIFAGLLVVALAVIGVNRWRRRRSQTEQSLHDPSDPTTHAKERK
jgi:hypothetical protein